MRVYMRVYMWVYMQTMVAPCNGGRTGVWTPIHADWGPWWPARAVVGPGWGHWSAGRIAVPTSQIGGPFFHPLKTTMVAAASAAGRSNQGVRRWQPYCPARFGRWKSRGDDRRRRLQRPHRALAPCQTRITAQFRPVFTSGAL